MPFKPPKPLRPPPPELAGANVMVVDDERVWRVVLETDLQMLGYRVSVASDAMEALDVARERGPEVAIIDLMLPEPMDGWALVQGLRKQGTPLPVIFYTAYPAFPDRSDDPDVVGCLSKAADRADLYDLLPVAIRTRRAKNGRP